ncbi:MAG TPA: energy transducer TonB [Candidatus Methylomirabilis sp.]|nr:energy transducer TonB [Candidatus Methylomirabilis sp.]
MGLDPVRLRQANRDAWKTAIGTKPIPARLAVLPDGNSRWNRIGVSALFQLTLLTFCILIPLIYPDQIRTALHYQMVAIAQPVTEIPVAPPPPPPPKVRAKTPPPPPKPEVVEPPKLDPKKPHIFEIPKAVQPKVRRVDALAPELQAHLEAAKIETTISQPKRPKEEVKLNNINSSGSAAPATVKAPLEKVQTGGFGDPNGIPGKGDPQHATNANRLGSPALPGGPGYGNGTGGAKGIPGTVASTGFGNGIANPPTSGKQGKVQATGFGDQNVVDAPKKKVAASGPADTPVDILDKPRPEYTAEGRTLKLEGDVVIDVVFLANGTIQVNRVMSGLGHGLDEAAVRAAQQIKFKPAKRDGQPVDYPARVRIEFRLAY